MQAIQVQVPLSLLQRRELTRQIQLRRIILIHGRHIKFQQMMQNTNLDGNLKNIHRLKTS